MSAPPHPPSSHPPPSHDVDGDRGAGVPWAGGRAVVDGVAIYVVAQILGGVAALLLAGTGSDSDALLPWLVALSPIASLLAALGWLRVRYPGRVGRVLGRRRPRAVDAAIGVGVGVACFLGQRVLTVAMVALATRMDAELPGVQETFRTIVGLPGALPLFVLTTAVLAPLSEEIVFRGIIFQGLRERTGFGVAALLSALLFTLPHLIEGGGPLALAIIAVNILPLGLVFAWVVERRGSVVTSMLAHGTYNAIGVAALVLLAPGAL